MALCRNWHSRNTIIKMGLGDTRNELHIQPKPHYGFNVMNEKGDSSMMDDQDVKSGSDGNDKDDDDEDNDDDDDDDGPDIDVVEMPREFEQPEVVPEARYNLRRPRNAPEKNDGPSSYDNYKRNLSSPFFDSNARNRKYQEQQEQKSNQQGSSSQPPQLPPGSPFAKKGGTRGIKRPMNFNLNLSPENDTFIKPPPSKKPSKPMNNPRPGPSRQFTARLDTISRNPPQVIRFSNPRGKWCWFNSGMNALIYVMQILILKGITFTWPIHMEWSDDAEDRPFLSFLQDYVNRNDSPGLDSPINAMKSYIREFRSDLTPVQQQQMTMVTGYAADLFQFVFSNDNMGTFFDFIKLMIAKTTRTTACTICTIQGTYNAETLPEPMLELRNLDRNMTLQENIENYFRDEFTSETARCRCDQDQAEIEIHTKYNLVTLPSAFIVKIGLEQYNINTGTFIQRSGIHLGNNVTLGTPEGYAREFELIGGILHTGQTVETGHFVTYLKKDSTWHLFNDGLAVLERQEKDVERADIFLYVQVESVADWQ